MTIASDAGFVIGGKYQVIDDTDHSGVNVGDILTMSRDDGTKCPLFRDIAKNLLACSLYRLQKIKDDTIFCNAEITPIDTNISKSKTLTTDQIKRICDIINE